MPPSNLPSGMRNTYIIAEMACSHDGSEDLAKVIIDGVGQAGANAIQFQVWLAADMMVPHHPQFDLVKSIELSRDIWRRLADYVRSKYPGMEIIACVYEHQSVDFCEDLNVDAYKLHSADLSNPHLVRHVAQSGKRIDLSVGASTIEEIRKAIDWIRSASDSKIWMMYGYQNFPTPTDAIHLNYMKQLRELFQLPVGYQDHSDGAAPSAFYLPAAAMGTGIDILEKHITHDRSKKGVDYQAALNPDEFKRFVEMVREIEAALGDSRPRAFSAEELKYRKYSKKSIVAARDLQKGETIVLDDLLFMRSDELGDPPDEADAMKGKKLTKSVQRYHLIRHGDLA
ncbi:N-acetylneuraminate synthase family protein [Candidatus Sumerlaeota bacterium]|nr:N-acetylneuraminate synthase family protein [Candidatus Sumerlaeota bacterium]